jgi:hypothetical protein
LPIDTVQSGQEAAISGFKRSPSSPDAASADQDSKKLRLEENNSVVADDGANTASETHSLISPATNHTNATFALNSRTNTSSSGEAPPSTVSTLSVRELDVV